MPLALARTRPSPVRTRNQLAFELSKPAKNRQHQAAVGRGRVCPIVAEGLERRACFRDLVEDVEQVPGRPGQPIKPSDDHNVSRVDGFQQPMKLSAMVCRAANLFLEYFRRARFVQGGLLCGQRLAGCADARVTVDSHDASQLCTYLMHIITPHDMGINGSVRMF